MRRTEKNISYCQRSGRVILQAEMSADNARVLEENTPSTRPVLSPELTPATCLSPSERYLTSDSRTSEALTGLEPVVCIIDEIPKVEPRHL